MSNEAVVVSLPVKAWTPVISGIKSANIVSLENRITLYCTYRVDSGSEPAPTDSDVANSPRMAGRLADFDATEACTIYIYNPSETIVGRVWIASS